MNILSFLAPKHVPTLQELQEERASYAKIWQDPNAEDSKRDNAQRMMFKLDEQISNLKWGDETPRGPSYQREHGRNLYKDD